MSRSIPLRELPRRLRQDRRNIVLAGKRAVRYATASGAETVRRNAPKAFGDLRASVHATNDKVVVDAPYAAAVEQGSRPHTVPLEELIQWVKLRGMQGLTKARVGRNVDPKKIGSTTKAQALRVASQLRSMEQNGALSIDAPEQIARAIQKAIEAHGTDPHWFAFKSLPELEESLGSYMRTFLDAAFANMGTG